MWSVVGNHFWLRSQALRLLLTSSRAPRCRLMPSQRLVAVVLRRSAAASRSFQTADLFDSRSSAAVRRAAASTDCSASSQAASLVAFSSSWPEESRSPDSIRHLRAMLQSLLAPAFAKSRLPQLLRNHSHRPHAPPGRPSGCPPSPPQTRTSAINASGSSERAFANV